MPTLEVNCIGFISAPVLFNCVTFTKSHSLSVLSVSPHLNADNGGTYLIGLLRRQRFNTCNGLKRVYGMKIVPIIVIVILSIFIIMY